MLFCWWWLVLQRAARTGGPAGHRKEFRKSLAFFALQTKTVNCACSWNETTIPAQTSSYERLALRAGREAAYLELSFHKYESHLEMALKSVRDCPYIILVIAISNEITVHTKR